MNQVSINDKEFCSDVFSKIADEYKDKWFEDPSKGMIDILLYPAVGTTVDELQNLIKIEWPQPQPGWKGLLGAVDFTGMKMFDTTSQVQVNNDLPRISLPSESIRDCEFNGPAIMVATPSQTGKDLIDCCPNSVVMPLFRLYRGSAIAWGPPRKIRYNCNTRETWFPQTTGKSYLSTTDGPFDAPAIAKNIGETLLSLTNTNFPERSRVFFALELFTDACEPTRVPLRMKVFQYWSAIEVLCDSHEENTILNHLFNKKQKATVENPTKLVKAARVMRHNVIHSGHEPLSCSNTLERFLQVIFLDIMRDILGLAYEGYVEKFAQTHDIQWLKETYKRL